MAAKLKALIPWVVAAFLIYAVVTSPDRSADLVRNLWEILADGFRNIGRFFNNLMGG